MEFKGQIIKILEKKGGMSKAGNSWACQEYVIESHDQYPKKMCFDVFGDEKISEFGIKMGEELTVHFDVDAKEWNGRWFNTLRAWRIEREAQTESVRSASVAPAPIPESVPDSNDLPF